MTIHTVYHVYGIKVTFDEMVDKMCPNADEEDIEQILRRLDGEYLDQDKFPDVIVRQLTHDLDSDVGFIVGVQMRECQTTVYYESCYRDLPKVWDPREEMDKMEEFDELVPNIAEFFNVEVDRPMVYLIQDVCHCCS